MLRHDTERIRAKRVSVYHVINNFGLGLVGGVAGA